MMQYHSNFVPFNLPMLLFSATCRINCEINWQKNLESQLIWCGFKRRIILRKLVTNNSDERMFDCGKLCSSNKHFVAGWNEFHRPNSSSEYRKYVRRFPGNLVCPSFPHIEADWTAVTDLYGKKSPPSPSSKMRSHAKHTLAAILEKTLENIFNES